MSHLLHARSHSALLCDQRSSHIAHLSSVPPQHRRTQGVFVKAESSRSGFESGRQYVRTGRRELLHSTALLTLPTLSRSDAQNSPQQPLSSAKESGVVSSTSVSGSGSKNEEPVLACRPPNPPLRISAPGRIVAGELMDKFGILSLRMSSLLVVVPPGDILAQLRLQNCTMPACCRGLRSVQCCYLFIVLERKHSLC